MTFLRMCSKVIEELGGELLTVLESFMLIEKERIEIVQFPPTCQNMWNTVASPRSNKVRKNRVALSLINILMG